MGQFRIVGIACDAQTKWTADGDPVHTYGPNAAGADCGEEFTLMGGSTFGDVIKAATREGWAVKGRGMNKAFLCATHAEAAQK